MGDIAFRYRDYNDPKARGTYLVVNGRQMERISARKLSRKEQNQLRKQMILTEAGYIETSPGKYQKAFGTDHIREVKDSEFNIVIADIYKDNDKKWEKEPAKEREYLANDENVEELKKKI